ncbi:MAG: NAD(P)-binding protein [Crocinitomix sp.]|nr:NAD(P)-binding protein [Crocinitomix sp.]
MKRKTFIQNTITAYLGLMITPALLSSCRKEDLLPDSNFSGKVIIIGAGAAGLYAGFILKSLGIDFTILEASNKAGGRLGKLTDFADFPIDLGAQWLHGRNSVLGDLAQNSGTAISVDNSEARYWFNGGLVATNPLNWDFEDQDNLPDVSFLAYAEQNGFGAEYKFLVEQIAGDFGADSSEISAKWTKAEEEEWNSGETDYKFQETFFDLIDKNITATISDRIHLNTVVSKIDYSGDQLTVTDNASINYNADKIIITVPITVLQDEDIEFVPALPAAKTEAFNKIGMGAGMKVFLKFSSKFYDENIGGGEICAAYADEITGKTGNDNILLAFVMGKQAEYLTSLGSDLEITNALLSELDNMYDNQATASFMDAHVENWTTHPYIKGAYSFSTIGIGDARSIATESIDNKLFFAGEAMNINGHHQTVHGAAETGYREVINLLKSE